MEFFEGEEWHDTDIDKIITGDIQLDNNPPEMVDNLLSGIKLTRVKRKPKEIE
jgi:hypothetical protein